MSETQASLPTSYAFGIQEIDEQHGILFGFIAELESALESEQGWMAVHEVLVKLTHWTEVHFAVEEALMHIMAYPATQEHCHQHKGFVVRLNTYKNQSLREDVAAEAASWLREWLSRHIDLEDRLYAEHFYRNVSTP